MGGVVSLDYLGMVEEGWGEDVRVNQKDGAEGEGGAGEEGHF